MSSFEQRLKELNITLPVVSKPVAAYVPVVEWGGVAQTAGTLPRKEDGTLATGKLGAGVTIDQGKADARTACLNALSSLKAHLGSLDRIERILSLTVYVQSADDFFDQPKVANGASELLLEIFGPAGEHVRAALGNNALPLNASVELAITAAVKKN